MSKIIFENKKGKIIITNKLTFPETVNVRIYNAIVAGMFEGVLPISIYQKRKETRIECVVQGLISLTQYFDGVVSKKMFLDFVHDIAGQIKNCEKNRVNDNNLDLQSDRIFVDPITKRVKCIFWPVVNNQRGTPSYVFLKQLPLELDFNQQEDNSYLVTYRDFFDGTNPFSINSFDKMVTKLLEEDASGGDVASSSVSPSRIKDAIKSETNVSDANNQINREYNPFTSEGSQAGERENVTEYKHDVSHVFCQHCGAKNMADSNYCTNCGMKITNKNYTKESSTNDGVNELYTTSLNGSIGTTVLGYQVLENFRYPTLVRSKTEETYLVDKPTYRIGTEQSYCDLFICDNSFISRSHADIVTRKDRYYIVDRNSTNKTFVDGKVIPPEREIEIFQGTHIRLANEEFFFNTTKLL